MHPRMTVEARVGLWKGHEVQVDGSRFEVRRQKGGWYAIDGPVPSLSGRVRYSEWKDVLLVDRPEGSLEIRFGWWGTTVSWHGRSYRLRESVWGRLRLYDGERVVAEGHMTFRGFRLEQLSPEFAPMARELAFGLALRAQMRMAWATVAGGA